MRRIALGTIFLVALHSLCSCGYKTNPRPTAARIPAEIKVVNAQAYPKGITLNWTVPLSNTDGSQLQDLSGFKVFRGSRGSDEDCDNCQEKRELYANIDFQAPSNATIKDGSVIFEDKGVSPGKVYSYAVTAYNLRGRESVIGNGLDVFYEAPPPAPTNLIARTEEGHIRIEWTAPSDEKIDRYQIFRGENSDINTMKSLGTTPFRESWFVDKDFEKNKKYYYAVKSVKSNRGAPFESAASNVSETVAPSVYWSPPENVNVAMTRQGVRVYWNPVKIENEEIQYNVYRSESGRAFQKINPEPVRTAWLLDSKVTRGSVYRYAITAFPKNRPEEESARTASEGLRYTY